MSTCNLGSELSWKPGKVLSITIAVGDGSCTCGAYSCLYACLHGCGCVSACTHTCAYGDLCMKLEVEDRCLF